ncbi:TraR/DksA family transcriptional regulator [Parafrigoribacterium soli]|uniref:TraR/DksA family transcriptional regulator n=1 Tax=Parafrigoribacterium soli TaxID=3144663 RepID=UPI0032EE3FA4
MTTTPVVERPQAKLTARQVAKLRARLVDDLEQTRDLISQLMVDLEEMRSSRQDVATDDEHDPEGPTLAFERSQASAVLNDARSHFAGIEDALLRVDGDDYGVCENCHERIPFGRLEARPYALYCVSCAERAER